MKNHLRFKVLTPDAIPYACYYNKNTILTKNGELLKTIEIKFPEDVEIDEALNKKIRSAINKTIKANISYWINVTREPKPIAAIDKDIYFSKKLITEWNGSNKWESRIFENKVYLTIIIGNTTEKHITSLLLNFFKKKIKNKLKKMSIKLNKISKKIIEILEPYKTKTLSLTKENNKYYSEHIRLYCKILFWEDSPVEITTEDITNLIMKNRIIDINFTSIQIQSKTNNIYTTCFCIKSYFTMNNECMYQLTSIEQSTSFTEVITKFSTLETDQKIKKYYKILKNNESINLIKTMSMDKIVDQIDKKQSPILCNQLIISIFSKSQENLEIQATKIQKEIDKTGINIVRLDLNIEQGFLSQIPANFNYMIHQHPIYNKQIGQISFLDTEISGNAHNINFQKAYVTILINEYNRAYFFNFYFNKFGHTFVFGDVTQRTILTNFLIARILNRNYQALIIDYNQSSRVFVNSMIGKYLIVSPHKNASKFGINFLNVKNNENGKKTLEKCMQILVGTKRKIEEKLIEKILDIPKENRSLTEIKDIMKEYSFDIDEWCIGYENGGIFDNAKSIEILESDSKIMGIDITKISDNTKAMSITLEYLTYYIEELKTDSNKIIVFSNIAKMNQIKKLSKNLEEWLKEINKKNIMTIIASSYKDLEKTNITDIDKNIVASKIMIPEIGSYKITTLLGIEDTEERWIKTTRPMSGKFIYQYGEKRHILDFNIKNLKSAKMLFSNTEKIQEMLSLKKKHENNTKKWIDDMIGDINETIN